MLPKILINIGINPRPQCPSYYNNFFNKIIHLCPGKSPGKHSRLNKNEILINIDARGFNLQSYGLCQESENTYVEIALQSGINYGNLLIPDNCYIIGRVCDIHHLNNPLISIIDYTRWLNFKCLVFSSCPQYISLFESIVLVMSVSIKPGATLFTNMLYFANSKARVLVKPSIANFEAE